MSKVWSCVVVACADTIDLAIMNTTAQRPVTEGSGSNKESNTTTKIPVTLSSGGIQSFMRGTRIMVRCSAVSFPEPAIRLSIPGLNLNPEWQNLTESPGENGYVRRTLDAWFTLDAADNLLRATDLTIECQALVANGTCNTSSSLALQVVIPTTSKCIVNGRHWIEVTFSLNPPG